MAPCPIPHLPLRGLYAVTPDCEDTARLLSLVEAVLAGGVRWVQYRNKVAGKSLRREQAERLAACCRVAEAALIINDDVELALAVDAAGAHLGAGDGDLASARARLGTARILGASCYASLENARLARAAGVDYVAFGALFPSSTKPHAVTAPLELLAAARVELGLPVVGIGGITSCNAPRVIAAGGDLLAVVSDLFDAPDPALRAREFQKLFAQGFPS